MHAILKATASLAFAAAFATVAFAQAPAKVRVRGTVEKIDGAALTIKARDGASVAIKLNDDWAVSAIVKASRDDIKPGAFVGAGAMPQADGTQKAVQVFIFPEAMRGTGEGFRPWDFLPESTMTNATVAEAVAGVTKDSSSAVLTYKGGSQKMTIPPDAMIITLAPGDKAELKAGAAVAVTADKAADGTLTASRFSVGRVGVTPN